MAQSIQIKTVKVWHEELMDFMLAQPRAGLKEASEYFGVSMSWLSIVKNSDAFKTAWEKRREDHSSAVSVSIVQRVEALAEVALETMTQKLEREGESIGLSTLREVSETALKSLGFGMRDSGRGAAQSAQSIHNNTMIVVDRDTLARARDARARMQLGTNAPAVQTSLESASVEQAALLRHLDTSLAGYSDGDGVSGELSGPERTQVRHELDLSGPEIMKNEGKMEEIEEKGLDPPRRVAVLDDIPPRYSAKNSIPRKNLADQSVLEMFAEFSKEKKS